MKISVIVPVYNASKYIDKLINSVINQTYKDYELILVDDGSTDNSFEIIKEWENKNKKIKAFTKKNTGPGYTRKYGFEKSTGDLLFFVDSDDWVTNNDVFKDINYIFDNNDIDVLFFDREDILEDTKDIIVGFKNVSVGYHTTKEQIKDFIRSGLGAKIFKKSILTSDMFFNTNVYEDLYTTYKYLDKCNNFYYINKSFYTIYHVMNSNSLSAVKNLNDFESYKEALNILLNLYDNISNDSLKYSLSLRMAPLLMVYYKRYKKIKDSDLNNKIIKLIEILKFNKISYKSDNNKEPKQYLKYNLKKLYYWFILNIYNFKV